MGIEQNKEGAYLPDKETKWPEMSQEERSKVYGSLKETYGGKLSQLDLKSELEKKKIKDDVEKKLGVELDTFWATVESNDFTNEYKAGDPKLKGMPVSMALYLTFKEKMVPGHKEDMGLVGKEKQLMLFCLNYLQNAPENKALNPKGNIDLVPKDGYVRVDTNSAGRWMLFVENSKRERIFEGYLFPGE